MNDFAIDLNEIQQAISRSSGGGEFPDRPYEFLKIADGETTTYRIVSGIEEKTVYSHHCGLTEYEVATQFINETVAAGKQMTCPQCGEPLLDSDVVAVRPAVIAAWTHNFVPSSSGTNTRFVCLNKLKSNLDAQGNPIVPCPVCAVTTTNDKGKVVPAHPARLSLFGLALERKKRMTQGMANGVFTSVIEGIDTVMNDKGEPKLVLIEKGINFWKQLISIYESNKSIAYWDYDVSRIGQGTGTTYSIQRVSNDPTILPFSSYSDGLTTSVKYLTDSLDYQGSAKHYNKSGWSVDGSAPEAVSAPAPSAAQTPVAVPAGAVSFNDISERIAGTNESIANYI